MNVSETNETAQIQPYPEYAPMTNSYPILCVVCGNTARSNDRRTCSQMPCPLSCQAVSHKCNTCNENFESLDDWHHTDFDGEYGPVGQCYHCFIDSFCTHCNKKLTEDEIKYLGDLDERLCTNCGYRFLK